MEPSGSLSPDPGWPRPSSVDQVAEADGRSKLSVYGCARPSHEALAGACRARSGNAHPSDMKVLDDLNRVAVWVGDPGDQETPEPFVW